MIPLPKSLHCVGALLDRFAACELWLRARLTLAERRLAATLEWFGDGTFEERCAAARVGKADQDLKLWKRLRDELRVPAKMLEARGASVEDLRVLFLNREIRTDDSFVSLSPAWRNYVLTAAAAGVVLSGFVMLLVVTVFAPGSVFEKGAVITAITLIVCTLYQPLSLFTSRPIPIRTRVAAYLPMETAPISATGRITRLSNRTWPSRKR